MVPRAANGVHFLDRSRRIYRISPNAEGPQFFACLPAEVGAVENSIGFTADGPIVYLGRAEGSHGSEQVKAQTSLYRLRLGEGVQVEQRVRLEPGRDYGAVGFDVPGERAFLAIRDRAEIEVVALDAGRPKTRPLVTLESLQTASSLVYDPSRNRLYASDREQRIVFVDLDDDPPTAVVAAEMPLPTAMAVDGARGRLYVATANDGVLWRIDCREDCGPPRVFARLSDGARPTHLVVSADGTLWVSDLSAQRILALNPDGSVEHVHDQMPPE